MESKGEEGRVLISESTLDIINDYLNDYTFEEGPIVEVPSLGR